MAYKCKCGHSTERWRLQIAEMSMQHYMFVSFWLNTQCSRVIWIRTKIRSTAHSSKYLPFQKTEYNVTKESIGPYRFLVDSNAEMNKRQVLFLLVKANWLNTRCLWVISIHTKSKSTAHHTREAKQISRILANCETEYVDSNADSYNSYLNDNWMTDCN